MVFSHILYIYKQYVKRELADKMGAKKIDRYKYISIKENKMHPSIGCIFSP